jgi:hypothetical protein
MICTKPRRTLFAPFTFLALSSLVACGGGDTDPPDDPDAAAGPAFAIGTRVWDDTTTTSFFNVVGSLSAGTVVDTSQAIEVAGAAKLFSLGSLGWFAIGGGESPTISRYEVDADNQLVPRETISLQNYGVESLWDTIYVVSPTKAYYPDRDNRQLIIWNPTAMTISGSIDLAQTEREGYLSLYGYTPVIRGNQLLFTVGWFDWTTNDTVLAETGLVVIDTATDTVARFDVDDRCGGITTGIEVANGDVYFASSALAGAAHMLERLTTEPCALRLLADATAFDPTYRVQLDTLDTLADGAVAGEPVSGGGDRIFLRVFDEEAAELPAEPATWDVTGQVAWTWLAWDVGTDTAAAASSLPPSTADVVWFEVEGVTYGAQTTADYSSTTLIDLTAATPTPALTAPGFVHGVARVR